MNFFGFRSIGRTAVRGSSGALFLQEYEQLRDRYAHYCASTMIPHERAREQFRALCALRQVASVGFDRETGAFLVGTELIVLTGKDGAEYEIGEFIIMTDRSDRSIRFENVTRSRRSTSNNFETYHPHIHGGTGAICMPMGGDSMMTALYAGNLLLATEYALAGLNTYNPNGHPYSKLEAWPRRKHHDT